AASTAPESTPAPASLLAIQPDQRPTGPSLILPDVVPERRNVGRMIAIGFLALLVIVAGWFIVHRATAPSDPTSASTPRG
ncbi:MAG TPA: hypothetical protein VHV78_15135, partial [Gemmatimonadaceae bacterium]|nr:hypothetical protein [Gemmatimonadaceae bacterium]